MNPNLVVGLFALVAIVAILSTYFLVRRAYDLSREILASDRMAPIPAQPDIFVGPQTREKTPEERLQEMVDADTRPEGEW